MFWVRVKTKPLGAGVSSSPPPPASTLTRQLNINVSNISLYSPNHVHERRDENPQKKHSCYAEKKAAHYGQHDCLYWRHVKKGIDYFLMMVVVVVMTRTLMLMPLSLLMPIKNVVDLDDRFSSHVKPETPISRQEIDTIHPWSCNHQSPFLPTTQFLIKYMTQPTGK